MMRTAAVVTIATSSLIAGCDNPPWCHDPCNKPGHVRDAFCDCFDPNQQSGTSKPSNPSSSADAYADCICSYSNGTVGAWFRNRPAAYQKFGTLKVSSGSCADLSLCERIKNSDLSETIPFITGTAFISANNWVENVNLLNGHTLWVLFGRLVQQSSIPESDLEQRLAMQALRELRFSTKFLRRIAADNFVNTASNCKVECSKESPFCFASAIPQDQSASLRQLYRLTSVKPPKIDMREMLDIFNIANDPCGRSSILFGEIVENSGDICSLRSHIVSGPFSVDATITMPEIVRATGSFLANEMQFEFSDPGAAPSLKLDDENLNADWGGIAKSIVATPTSMTVAVGAESCIQVQY